MFDNLRRAFAEAVDNFNREMEKDAVPETVNRLLRGMDREAAEVKAQLEELEKDLDRARRRSDAEGKEAETCRRREAMARGIGDDETAEVAAKFAARHAERSRVLRNKADAIEAELRLLESDYGEMVDQLRKARASGGSAGTGGADARGVAHGGADDGADLDAELLRERRAEVIDARLEELKRRMGRK